MLCFIFDKWIKESLFLRVKERDAIFINRTRKLYMDVSCKTQKSSVFNGKVKLEPQFSFPEGDCYLKFVQLW